MRYSASPSSWLPMQQDPTQPVSYKLSFWKMTFVCLATLGLWGFTLFDPIMHTLFFRLPYL